MTTPTNTDRIEARLQELESNLASTRQSLRRTRRWLGMTGLGGVVLMVAAAADLAVIDVIRTKRMEILDNSGNVVLAASSDADGGRLDIWTPKGCNVLRASANENGGDMAIWNCQGRSIAGLFANEQGGEISIWNKDGGRSARLHDAGQGGLLELKKDDRLRASIGGTMIGSAVELFDTKDARITSISTADDAGYLAIRDRFRVASSSTQTELTLTDDSRTHTAQILGATNMASMSIQSTSGTAKMHSGDATTPPAMAVVNGEGNIAAHMTIRKNGGGTLTTSSSDGMEVASIRSDASGNGRLDLSDANGTLMATMQTLAQRGSTLALMSPNGKRACAMAASQDGGVLNLSNGQGSPVLVGGIPSGRRDGALNLYNQRGVPVISAGSTIGGFGQLSINDDNGHRLITWPQRFESTQAETNPNQ